MTVMQNVSRFTPSLGRGKIGPVTSEHLKAVNAWLSPLVERDGLRPCVTLGARDIERLLELGRGNNEKFAGNIAAAPDLRDALLIDMGQAVTQIRWGNGPWEDDAQTSVDMRVRITRRARIMLQKCCPDLWNEMLYGKPPPSMQDIHQVDLVTGNCTACGASREAWLDKLAPVCVPDGKPHPRLAAKFDEVPYD